MNVPEKFIVYQVQPDNAFQWEEVTQTFYERFKGAKRRLCIMPQYHIHVRLWFSPANGWYVSFDVREGTKQVMKNPPIPGTGEDNSWVRAVLLRMHTKGLLSEHYWDKNPGTLFLRETLNIDYDVTEVQRKGDL